MAMNIKCLLGHHDWRFSYNHNMPLGASTEGALKMFEENKTFAVDECRRCKAQSRLVNGKRVMLNRDEIETP